MTTLATNTTASLDMERPDDLWHLAADDLHDFRAERGMTWLTLCGQMRPPSRASRAMTLDVHPDDCLRCLALNATADPSP